MLQKCFQIILPCFSTFGRMTYLTLLILRKMVSAYGIIETVHSLSLTTATIFLMKFRRLC